MLNNTTSEKLREIKLFAMEEAFREQLKGREFLDMSFEDRFGILVDREWLCRKNNRLERLIKNSNYCYSDACLENIEYHADRNLDKNQITRLGTCSYIDEHHNIIILGATGSGKTFMANAFGIAANRNFYTVKYIRLPELLDELALARGDGSYHKAIKKYKQVNLLILDEWLMLPLNEIEARDLLEIIESRYKKASTIFSSQFDIDGWYTKIGYPALADAICDRIAHDSYTIVIKGDDSMRKRKGLNA